jgi:hypothetical protein
MPGNGGFPPPLQEGLHVRDRPLDLAIISRYPSASKMHANVPVTMIGTAGGDGDRRCYVVRTEAVCQDCSPC